MGAYQQTVKKMKSQSENELFFHTDQSDQAHLSQNGDILLKCTLQTYSCSPASFLAKGKSIHTLTSMVLSIFVYICIYIYTHFLYIHVYIYIYICICVYVYSLEIFKYLCVYIYIYNMIQKACWHNLWQR